MQARERSTEQAGLAAHAHGVLRIDLQSLKENWRRLAKRVAPAECGAAVKANAYGLGIEPCARALWEAGCKTFFVALPQEGGDLRTLLPEATIYVLSGLLPGSAPLYLASRLIPSLSSPEEIEEWAVATRARGGRPGAALHVDTGMNRLGLSREQVQALQSSPALKSIEVGLVMTHLACADDPSSPMNTRQLGAFMALRARLPNAAASIANSAGIFLGREFHCDLVRPGIALYGGNPFLEGENPMSPVVELTATLLQVRHIAEGETVGYGATWRAERPSRIGVVSSGYHDGLRRSLAGGPALAYIGGLKAPIVGRISMDLLTIDLTDVPPELARRGTAVELMGAHITVDDVARWAGTIPYEILTGLGSRHARLYSPADSSR